MRRPRLTLVEFSPSGGLFQFALQLADGLAEVGYDVELITGRNPELSPRTAGVRLVPILPTWHPQPAGVESRWLRKPRRAWRAFRYVDAWRRTERHLRRTRPDIVQFSEWRFALDGGAVAILSRRLPGVLFGSVAHTPRPLAEQRTGGGLRKTGWLLNRALTAAYGRMDVVFVLGKNSRADLLAAFPHVRRVEVIPHGGADALLAAPSSAPSSAPPRVLLFGTIARYKGVDLLLDAWPLVREQSPDAELVIAGAPVDVDIEALRRRSAELGGVDLRLGYVSTEAVAVLIAGARVLVTPYLIANQSGVVHLAHSAGRPVVTTDVGDLAAAVAHDRTGLVVPPADPRALADALVRMLNDPAAADRMGAAGRDRLAAEATWPQVAGQIAAVYDDLQRAP
jgi:glycosyltransferase involved in cell wall biosynthesis